MDHLPLPPRDISTRRQYLFDLNHLPFRLSRSEYDLLWPMVDNVYSDRTQRKTRDGVISHYIICRFKRYTKPTNQSLNPTAKRRKRLESTCNVAFKILEYTNHFEFHSTGESINHTHDLDACDANKRHSFLIGLVKTDIARGYRPAQILQAIRGEAAEFASSDSPLRLIGGTYLTRQDIINCGSSWREKNPNTLFVDLATKSDVTLQAHDASAPAAIDRKVDEESHDIESGDMRARLNMEERLEQIRARFLELSEYSDSLELTQKAIIMQRFEDRLSEATNALIGLSLEDFISEV
ncbi:hypothetical protein BTUL_0200g00220 [Botrytis tulipae]|uniref:Uncharacterized protein n=1 Tax=Botrytis tulipae TaxID=87230 RepID=A0A4Z1EE53_9HELO|nr:hypothetical protein BTUL_0200g00220 [Botrytis tulipae]